MTHYIMEQGQQHSQENAVLDAAELGPILSKDFGDGWLTANAADLCKIAVTFAGFDAQQIIFAIHLIHKGKGLANSATVWRALGVVEKVNTDVKRVAIERGGEGGQDE